MACCILSDVAGSLTCSHNWEFLLSVRSLRCRHPVLRTKSSNGAGVAIRSASIAGRSPVGDECITERIPVALGNGSHDILFYFFRNEALAQSDAISQTLHMRVNNHSLLAECMRKDDVVIGRTGDNA